MRTGRSAETKMNRREPGSLLEEDGGAAAEDVLPSKTARERWMGLMKLVREKFPHCIMRGVNIADGTIISCETLQQSLSFVPSPASKDGAEPDFDSHWQALEALCERLDAGELAELRFSDGRPMRAKTPPEGRRFRFSINEN